MNYIDENFLKDSVCQKEIRKLIEDIEICRESQKEIDDMYDRFLDLIFCEMEQQLPRSGGNNGRKKHRNYKFRKPFWNQNLKLLFKEISILEKQLRLFECNHYRKRLSIHIKHLTVMLGCLPGRIPCLRFGII